MSERTKVLTRAGGFIGLQVTDIGGAILISPRRAEVLYDDLHNPHNLETALIYGSPQTGRSRSEN